MGDIADSLPLAEAAGDAGVFGKDFCWGLTRANVALTASAMTFTLADVPADVTNLKLVILASEPKGNGITRAYSKAAAFDDPVTPVSTAIDIKAKYDAKCGAPSAGYPKVFFKYFFVNTATGEKSGEKMASAVLSA